MPESDRAARRTRPPLLLLAVSLLLALGLAEIAVRWLQDVPYRPPRPSDPASWRGLLHRRSDLPGLLYELTPDRQGVATGVPIRTNRLGMRDDELVDDADVVRIAALGDSYTFGYGVRAEHTWPSQLERSLNAHGPGRYEVWNLGVGGYGTRDEAIVLEHRALPLGPDAVVVAYFLNDPQTAPVQPLPGHFHGNEWWQYSHLLRLVALAHYERDRERYGAGDYYRYLHNEPERWQSVLDGFAHMGALAAARERPLLLLILPVTPKTGSWSGYPYRDLHAKVAAAARERDLDVLDLLDVWSAHPPETLRLGQQDLHPTPLAHRLTAQAIQAHWGERLAALSPARGETS